MRPLPTALAVLALLGLLAAPARSVAREDEPQTGPERSTRIRGIAWSPDGSTLAFVSRFGRPLPPNVLEDGIWLCRVRDGTVQELPLPAVGSK